MTSPFAVPTSDVDLLRQTPLFASLPDEDLEAIAGALEARSYGAGERLFRTGDAGGGLLLVRSGIVRILTEREGREVELTRLCMGESYGELELLDAAPRATDAVARTAVVVLILTRVRMLALLERRPSVGAALLGALARHVRATDRLLETAATKNVNEVDTARSAAERAADRVGRAGGSFGFVACFLAANGAWMAMNLLGSRPLDPYPFLFLNVLLTVLMALQAPFILMSQERDASKDRVRADLDYKVNLKNELLIQGIRQGIEELRRRELRSWIVPP